MALPPTNPPGLVRDAEDLNKVVNGDGTTNRAGDSLPSIKAVFERINDDFDAMQAGELTAQAVEAADRAETAAEVSASAGRVYETSAAGQADSGLIGGDYFWVVSADNSEVLELWRKGASSATDTGKRTVDAEAVTRVRDLTAAGVFNFTWEQGAINTVGDKFNAGNRVRTRDIRVRANGYLSVSLNNENQEVRIAFYDDVGEFIGFDEYETSKNRVRIEGRFALLVRNSDDSAITPQEVNPRVTFEGEVEATGEAARGLLYRIQYRRSSYSPSTGEALGGFNNRIRPDNPAYIPLNGGLLITLDNPDQEVDIYLYDNDKNFLGNVGYAAGRSFAVVDGYFGFIVRNADDSVINISENTARVYLNNNLAMLPLLEEELEELEEGVAANRSLIMTGIYPVRWERGSISPVGEEIGTPTRVRIIGHKLPVDGFITVSVSNPEQSVRLVRYDENGEFISYGEYAQEHKDVRINGFFNVLVRFNDDSPILPEQQSATVKASRAQDGATRQDEDDEWLDSIPLFSNTELGYAIDLPIGDKQLLFESILEGYPAALVEEKIGESFDGEHDINAYTLTPESYQVTIAVTCHTHGNERYNPLGFFALLSSIGSNKNKSKILTWMMNNVRWVVVPFVSPAAYVANSRATDGVNLNRNFDYRWDQAPDGNKGAAPNSQVETQTIVGYFTDLKSEIDFHMDLHDIPGAVGAGYSYQPFQNREFLWEASQNKTRDHLAKINQGRSGSKYVGAFGTVTNFFNSVLGIPSIAPEHVTRWWVNKGLSVDQQIAKAAEQTAAFVTMFKHEWRDRRGSAFYERCFEASFGSQEHGYYQWGSQDVYDAFSGLDGFSESAEINNVYIKSSPSREDKILFLSGLSGDDHNSSLTLLRCMGRIANDESMWVNHLNNCSIVVAPIANPDGLQETELQEYIEGLVAEFNPTYTVIVRADALSAAPSVTQVRVGDLSDVTQKTAQTGLDIIDQKVGVENYITVPYTVFELGNQVVGAGYYSHCVAEWVGYVVNDAASYFADRPIVE